VKFEVADARTFPGDDYNLICFFDNLHDMGDPLGAARRASAVLGKDGSALIVEPMAGNTVEENFNPIGRTFAAASTPMLHVELSGARWPGTRRRRFRKSNSRYSDLRRLQTISPRD